MILFFLLFNIGKIFKVKYYSILEKEITENVFKKRNFIMKYNKNELRLTRGTKNYMIDRCRYILYDSKYFGHLNTCNGIKGMLCSHEKCIKIIAPNPKKINELDIKEFSPKKLVINNFFNLNLNEESQSNFYIEDNELTLRLNSILIYKKILSINLSFINDFSRFKILREKVYDDTFFIFNKMIEIFTNLDFGMLSIKLKLNEIITRTSSELIKNTSMLDPLATFQKELSIQISPLFKKIILSDLIILLRNDTEAESEGMSYFEGFKDADYKFIIVNLDNNDDVMYKAKVIIHEILHTLGSTHDKKEKGSIMEDTFINKKSDKIKISMKTRNEIEIFALKNLELKNNTSN